MIYVELSTTKGQPHHLVAKDYRGHDVLVGLASSKVGAKAIADFLNLPTNEPLVKLLRLSSEKGKTVDQNHELLRLISRQEALADVPVLTDEETALVESGKLIAAIKEVRARLGIRLVEAKRIVDRWRFAR